MIKIESSEQLKELITLAKGKGLKSNNFYVLPAESEKKISKGTLFFEELKDVLVLLVKEDSFYRVYYFFNDEKVLNSKIELDQDAVIEFPFNESMKSKFENAQTRIAELGFILGRESGEMICEVENLLSNSFPEIVEIAKQEDTEEVLSRIRNTFDPLYAFIPSKEELKNKIMNHEVFVIKKDGELLGLLNSSIQKQTAIIDHIAISEKARGLGYGSILVNYFMNHYRNDVKSYKHWVDLHNKAALSLYEKMGYSFTIKRANEYIKRVSI